MFLMIVDTHTHTHTEGLSGHSSTAVHPLEPGDHCSSSLGLIRPAMCPTGPAQSCSHSFPFLPPPPPVPGPGRPLSQQTVTLTRPPLYFLLLPGILPGASSGWLQKQSHCGREEAPLPLRPSASVSGDYSLSSSLHKGLLRRSDRECMSAPLGLLVWDSSNHITYTQSPPLRALRPLDALRVALVCFWSGCKTRRWLFKENSYLFDTKSPVNILM